MKYLKLFKKAISDRDTKAAIELQKMMVPDVEVGNRINKLETICAFDISYDKSSNMNFAAGVMMSFPRLEFIEASSIIRKAEFPYVPGLLAFREGPAILSAYEKFPQKPDILLFDGHGLAHPRGMGIATMMGVLLDSPSIGCAKTKLIGDYAQPDDNKGSHTSLTYKGFEVGCVLRTRKSVKPVFVSVGHRVAHSSAREIVLRCCPKYRIPEPIRAAHNLANLIREEYNSADIQK